MSRTEAVTVALTSEEKDRWKLALACTGYPNLSAFVRESMEQICEMILSVGEIEELEVVFMLQPRSDGIKTEKMDRNLGVRCENGWQRLQ